MKLWLALLCFSFLGGIAMRRASLRTMRWLLFGLCVLVSVGIFIFRLI